MENDTARESIKRISANFELELLRHIKTLNLISQSKELFRDQTAGMEAFTEGYKIRLNDFKKRLSGTGGGGRHAAGASPDNPFTAPPEKAPEPEYVLGVVEDMRRYLDEIGSDLEKLKSEYLGKLDAVYSVYNMELGASQADLDTRLRELERDLVRAAHAAPTEPEKTAALETEIPAHAVPPGPEEKAATEKTFVPRIDYIGPDPTVDNITNLKPAEKKCAEPARETAEKKEARPVQSPATAQAGFKSPYVMSAGLLVMGLILGVIFYDALMRTWGIQDYTNGQAQMEAAEKTAPAAPPIEDPVEDPVEDKGLLAENPVPREEPANGTVPEEPAPVAQATPDETAGAAQSPAEDAGSPGESAAPEAGDTPSAKTGGDDTAAAPAPVAESAPANTAGGAAAYTYTVTGPGANVRSGPGMGYDVVTEVRGGETLTGAGEVRGRWVKVTSPGGSEGWISSKLLKEGE